MISEAILHSALLIRCKALLLVRCRYEEGKEEEEEEEEGEEEGEERVEDGELAVVVVVVVGRGRTSSLKMTRRGRAGPPPYQLYNAFHTLPVTKMKSPSLYLLLYSRLCLFMR